MKKKNKITLKELIIELQPFSEELVIWCKTHPKFLTALKNVYPEKFISPAMIDTSYPQSGDEIIAVYSYHYEIKNPIFKKDFIVNKDNSNQEFILYARNPTGSSKYVKDINDFFDKYAKYGYDKKSHHQTLEELLPQLQERGREAIKNAEKMKSGVVQEIPQDHIDKIYKEVMSIKRKDRYVKQKLDN